MTILSGTKLVVLSTPAGQRPWTVADKLARDSKCSLTPFFPFMSISSHYTLSVSFYSDPKYPASYTPGGIILF